MFNNVDWERMRTSHLCVLNDLLLTHWSETELIWHYIFYHIRKIPKFYKVKSILYGDYRFLRVIHHLWLLHSFSNSSSKIIKSGEKGFDEGILFRTECFNISHSLNAVQLWVFVLIITYWKKKLLEWGLSNALFY